MLLNLFLFIVQALGDRLPEQIKLSWTGSPGEYKVTWSTYELLKPALRYAPFDSDKWKTVYATQTIFQEGEHRSMIKNVALIQNLTEGKKYKYYVGSFPYYSEFIPFKTKTPGGNSTEVFNIAAFGDWGIGSLGKTTKDGLSLYMNQYGLDGIFLFGDLGYDLQDNEGKVGDEFLKEIQELSSKIPVMVVPGNHEDYQNFTQVTGRFSMPSNTYNQGTGLFYSLDLGPAHIIMLTTEFYFLEGYNDTAADQMEFLKNDLQKANANRKERPWIIVMTHHPMYCSSDVLSVCSADAEKLRSVFENLFYTEKVDLMLAGHLHYYERDGAVYKNETAHCDREETYLIKNANATVYIVSGAAGTKEPVTPIPTNRPEWSREFSSAVGYGLLKLTSKTTILWEQYDARYNTVVDHLYLVKDK